MKSIRAYRFRIYPDAKRQEGIDMQMRLCKELYNKLLEMTKEKYKDDKSFRINRTSLNNTMKYVINRDRDFLKIYSQTRQNVFDRLLRAYANFFRRLKEKRAGKRIKVGFPRFKSIDKYHSVVYPQDNGAFSIEKNRLRISKIGTMRIAIHRPMEGTIKSMTIKRNAGKYHVIFTTEREIEVQRIKDTNPVGIDVGLTSFIALSDRRKVEKPKFFNRRKRRIAIWQRRIARKRRGSRNRERAKLKLQEEFEYITNQSDDFAHKLSNTLIKSGYTSFAVERLDIRSMVKNHNLAQSIHNASWNRFIQTISYKAESAGLGLYFVPSKDSTQECSACGHIKRDEERIRLSMREYNCSACGLSMDRDLNASRVILKRATAGHAGSHAFGDGVRPQEKEATADELGTYSTIDNRGGSPHL